jgi:hypothetical protein
MAITSVWPRPPYLLHARRAGRLSDSPNPRAVLTYAEPGTSPASLRGFLFCGRVLRASILVGKGERRARPAQSIERGHPRMATRRRARPRWRLSPRAGGGNTPSAIVAAQWCRSQRARMIRRSVFSEAGEGARGDRSLRPNYFPGPARGDGGFCGLLMNGPPTRLPVAYRRPRVSLAISPVRIRVSNL